jgi:alkaline phosphatase
MTRQTPRSFITALAAIAVMFTMQSHSNSAEAGQAASSASPEARYVFIFLADGGGLTQMEITRLYIRQIYGEDMVIPDKIMKEGTLGLYTTHAANSLSTDSAAAATALASGCKANLGALGMCADGTIPKTVMEIAKEKGMRTGLVTTATIYDASPAGFTTHIPNRRDYGAIVDQYFKFAPDLLLGGGRDQFLPQIQPGSQRKDDLDLIHGFTSKGYQYVSNKDELERAKKGKVLGLFSLKDMSLELDRDPRTEPSLHEMTQAAIRLLYNGNSRGFVAFIENENVDTAGHLSDVASTIQAYREFDRSVGLAYEFYRKHPRETLILVTADHETGGLGFTQALKDLTRVRADNQVAATVEDLKKIHSISISLRKAAEILGPNPTSTAIDNLMKEHFKGFTLAPDIREAILKRQPLSRAIYLDFTANALGLMIANNTQAYWETSSHTNHPVFVAAIGTGAEKFRGYQDNTNFGKKLKAIIEKENRLSRQSK